MPRAEQPLLSPGATTPVTKVLEHGRLAPDASAEGQKTGGGSWCRWLVAWLAIAVFYGVIGFALSWLMFETYFGRISGLMGVDSCDIVMTNVTRDERAVDTLLGAAPAWLRTMILTVLGTVLCRKVTGYDKQDVGLTHALLVGRNSTLGVAQHAGWNAVVGGRGERGAATPQATWAQAQESRGLTWRQALSTAVAKLLFWHLSQPAVYLSMLWVYRCYVASLGGWQRQLSAIVAAREVLYLGSIALVSTFPLLLSTI
jgi:hypothetical protein